MASATAGGAESHQHPSAAAALADANLWATASGRCGWTGRSWGFGFGGLDPGFRTLRFFRLKCTLHDDFGLVLFMILVEQLSYLGEAR